jgi:hypothetical protein
MSYWLFRAILDRLHKMDAKLDLISEVKLDKGAKMDQKKLDQLAKRLGVDASAIQAAIDDTQGGE